MFDWDCKPMVRLQKRTSSRGSWCTKAQYKVVQLVDDCSSFNIGGIYIRCEDESLCSAQLYANAIIHYTFKQYYSVYNRETWMWKVVLSNTTEEFSNKYNGAYYINQALESMAVATHTADVRGWKGRDFQINTFEIPKDFGSLPDLALPTDGEYRVRVFGSGNTNEPDHEGLLKPSNQLHPSDARCSWD